ncbi:Predicted arabinose efflux permease, MFS family [Pseudoxanthomonas sp. GM95]|uniref:MFS transporter n=1 Tax=Pseudoxanthomonas sp. GM95 TaxID=1881043 RepID=UPI0008C2DED9|nr:MFS transporter [Pseudoxanthomonas sp. GM95]SEK70944.1 Predicted arabinose efflux permease, MFS family [Pseudoxanthomonas sp. GM95]
MPTAATPLRNDAKVLSLSALGGALEFYDFVVFVFFAKTLGALFFPADMPAWLQQLQTFAIFAAGYLVRPIGGVLMAHFGDRIGRKRLFAFSVFLMAVPTLCIGLLPTYAQIGIAAPLLLLLMRLTQGLAIGGEMPGAWVFVAEHAPANKVGFAIGTLSAGLSLGLLLGALVASAMAHWFTPAQLLDHAWRLPFLIGGVFGLISVWLRRWLDETPVFAQMRERKALATLPIRDVLRDHRAGVLVSMGATWALTAAIVVVILMTPTLVQSSFGIAPALASEGSVLASICLIAGCLWTGMLSDRIGRAPALLVSSLALMVGVYLLYLDLANGGRYFLPLYALAGFTAGVSGVAPGVMTAAFPAPVRFTGLALGYNAAYAIAGALTPPLIAYLAARVGAMAPAHYVAVVALVNVGLAIYLWKRPAAE